MFYILDLSFLLLSAIEFLRNSAIQVKFIIIIIIYYCEFFGDFDSEKKFARVNSRRFYCDLSNFRHCDIADVLNTFKLHREIGVILFAEKIAFKIAGNIACVNGPLGGGE